MSKKAHNQIKILAFSSFLIITLILTFLATSLFNISSLNKDKELYLLELKNKEWNYVYSLIKENQDKATIQATSIKDNIKRELLSSYDNIEELKYDMINLSENSKFTKIINKYAKGKYLNVENDNNDIFIIRNTTDKSQSLEPIIIFDKSVNHSKNGEIRNFEVESNMHYNIELALDTLNKISTQNANNLLFVEPISPIEKDNHTKLKYSNELQLKKIFLNEGLDSLSTYEFLLPIYLDSDKDVLGNDIVSLGQKKVNYQLIIVQGFNINDDIKSNYQKEISQFAEEEKLINSNFEKQKQLIEIEGLLFSALMLVVFMSVIKTQNMIIENDVD